MMIYVITSPVLGPGQGRRHDRGGGQRLRGPALTMLDLRYTILYVYHIYDMLYNI